MRYEFNPVEFLSKYKLTSIGGVFMGVASVCLMLMQVSLSYLDSISIATKANFLILGLVGAVGVSSAIEISIFRGWIHWLWLKVAILVSCVLINLPAFLYDASLGLYSAALMMPLLTLLLLLLNSEHQRAMRQGFFIARLWRHRTRWEGSVGE